MIYMYDAAGRIISFYIISVSIILHDIALVLIVHNHVHLHNEVINSSLRL